MIHALASMMLIGLAASAAASPPDVCALLTPEDVADVQGEEFTRATASEIGTKALCFYALPSFDLSVSLDVIREGAPEYWAANFSAEAQAKRDAKRAGKRKKGGPKPVTGVGREAFWTGNRTGSLYVFTGDAVLRISVGGAGTEEEKIERTKRLALAALDRIHG